MDGRKDIDQPAAHSLQYYSTKEVAVTMTYIHNIFDSSQLALVLGDSITDFAVEIFWFTLQIDSRTPAETKRPGVYWP